MKYVKIYLWIVKFGVCFGILFGGCMNANEKFMKAKSLNIHQVTSPFRLLSAFGDNVGGASVLKQR